MEKKFFKHYTKPIYGKAFYRFIQKTLSYFLKMYTFKVF